MAYDPTHAPRIIEQDLGRRGPSHWTYNGTDAPAVVAANGYISNAAALGMKVGDTFRYRQDGVSPPVVTTHEVLTINANGSADLSDGTVLATTNAG
jgi:hypothetical protein